MDEETARRAGEIQYAVSSALIARGIPLELLITLRKKGLSHQSIARVVGRTKENVRERLKGMDLEISLATEYAQNRAAILTIHQRRIPEFHKPEELAKGEPEG